MRQRLGSVCVPQVACDRLKVSQNDQPRYVIEAKK